MIITCPSCLSRFAVKAEAIGFSGRKVRCAKCKHSWFQDPPQESLTESKPITPEPEEVAPVPEGSNLPAAITSSGKPNNLYMRLAFAAAFMFFLFSLSVASSNKILPNMGWYYNSLGIHDDSGISLSNVSAEKVGEGAKKELLVKGRIVNQSKNDKAIPNLRIALFDNGKKKLRTVMLDSHDAALAPGEGVDFENHISSPPEATATVVMDIGNSINLATR